MSIKLRVKTYMKAIWVVYAMVFEKLPNTLTKSDAPIGTNYEKTSKLINNCLLN